MDAGVPINNPVAGISIGLVKEADKLIMLTDIIGDEDHFGDMDFKVAGTQNGITGIQLDLKIDGISEEIIRALWIRPAKAAARFSRRCSLALRKPRPEIEQVCPAAASIQDRSEQDWRC